MEGHMEALRSEISAGDEGNRQRLETESLSPTLPSAAVQGQLDTLRRTQDAFAESLDRGGPEHPNTHRPPKMIPRTS